MIKRLIKWFRRNPCEECKYYVALNGTCQSKKCASNNPYVTKVDRLFCEPCKENCADMRGAQDE